MVFFTCCLILLTFYVFGPLPAFLYMDVSVLCQSKGDSPKLHRIPISDERDGIAFFPHVDRPVPGRQMLTAQSRIDFLMRKEMRK